MCVYVMTLMQSWQLKVPGCDVPEAVACPVKNALVPLTASQENWVQWQTRIFVKELDRMQ